MVPSSFVGPQATAEFAEERTDAATLASELNFTVVSTAEPPQVGVPADNAVTEVAVENFSQCDNLTDLQTEVLDVDTLVRNNIPQNDLSDHVTVAGTDSGLSQMDIEIQHIDYMLYKLRNRRVLAAWKRNQYIPIARLPVEIMAEIFLCGTAITHAENRESEEPTTFPLMLGQVCHDWRHVAWQLSALWTHFTCRVSTRKCHVQAELLKEWLARSDNRLLFIHIALENESAWESGIVASTDIVDTLVVHCRRWRHINITLPACWYGNLAQVRSHLDNLTKVYVRPPNNTNISVPLDAFLDAPHLSRLMTAYNYLHDLHFPWTQLTKVVMTMVSTDEALELVRRCPNMTACHFDVLTSFESHFPIDVVLHNSISSLEVSVDASAFIEHLLMFLVLPSISVLALALRITHPTPIAAIESLIERSNAPLKRVDICGTYISDEDAIDFLKYNDCVLHLTTEP